MLEPVTNLEFFDDSHDYRYDGEWLAASVSEVLGWDMPLAQRQAIERTKDGPDGWAARGTETHKLFEAFLNGSPLDPESRWAEWMQPVAEDPRFVSRNFEVLATEYRVCDPIKSVGGSFDFLLRCEHDGVILGDLKTVSSRRGVSSRKPATAQLGAYVSMLGKFHPRLWIAECMTVVAGPGRCRIIREEPDACLEAWEEAWARYSIANHEF